MLALPGEPPPGVEATLLTEEPLRLAVNVDDELAGTTVAIEDLRGRPFILAEPGTALRETVVAATQAAGFSPLPLFEVGDPATVRYLVRANLGHRDRPGLLARAAGAGGRRGGPRPTRRATGCRCSRPRRGRHRPAGCCTSACSSSDSRRRFGRAPTSVRHGRAVLEEHEGRQPEHAVLDGQLLLVVRVDADDLEVVALGRELVQDRVHQATRRAPRGPEVDQHGLVGLQDLGGEGAVR